MGTNASINANTVSQSVGQNRVSSVYIFATQVLNNTAQTQKTSINQKKPKLTFDKSPPSNVPSAFHDSGSLERSFGCMPDISRRTEIVGDEGVLTPRDVDVAG